MPLSMRTGASLRENLWKAETTLASSDPRTWVWPKHERPHRVCSHRRTWTEGKLASQQEQRFKILPKLFMGFLFHIHLNLLVSTRHRYPGSQSVQGTRTGPNCGLSSCSFPWPEELWAVVEFSPDASHKQPLAAAKEMGVSLQIDC